MVSIKESEISSCVGFQCLGPIEVLPRVSVFNNTGNKTKAKFCSCSEILKSIISAK